MKAQFEKVTVLAPARLHMGFIDLSGSLGRDFGSIGVGLNEIYTRLSIRAAQSLSVKGMGDERAKECVQRLCDSLGVADAIEIERRRRAKLARQQKVELRIGSTLADT